MKNWKIGIRIMAGFAVVIAIAAALGIFAVNRAQKTGEEGDRLEDNYLPSVVSMYRIQVNLYHRIELLLKIVASSEPAAIARFNAEIAATAADTAKDIEAYEATPTETQREKDVYAESKITRAKFLAVFEDVRRAGSIGTDAENVHAQKIFDEQLQPLYEKYASEIQEIVETNRTGANSSMRSIQDSVRNSIRGVLIGLLLCIAISIPITIYIVRGITRPLGLAVSTLQQVAGGDLTVSMAVDTRDEIGSLASALNATIEKLRTTLRGVVEGAANTNSASQQLAAAADAISSGAQEQTASLEETSASLEQITAAVRQSADNANQARQLANGSRESAEKGQGVVTTAIAAMGEINTASAKISDIISTINEIAFQTNLLAVNAAVEAARAGEQGLGFAVVSSEVRSLAQRSAAAAKEIRVLIQESLDKVEKGSELVDRSGATLQAIVGSVKRVTDIVGEIAAAAAEQSTGVEQVNTAVTQMDQITQSNAAQTEELSSTAQALAGQANRLSELVSVFKLDDGRPPRTGRSHQLATTARRAVIPQPHAVKNARSVSASKSTGRRHELVPSVAVIDAPGSDDNRFEEF